MAKTSRSLIAAILAVTTVAGAAGATEHAEFFKGKTMRIIVGFSPGGGFDLYSRAIARHMGRHIPGQPTVIVENMGGAGSLVAANHVYSVARPDGLTMGNFIGSHVLGQVMGWPGIQFDARKFEWVGSSQKEHTVCVLSKASGVTSMEQWLAARAPVKIGDAGLGSPFNTPKILRATVPNLPIQIVSGYKGMADVRLAVEAGEVAGLCTSWESFKATWSKQLESGQIVPVLQATPKRHPELPQVPLAVEFARTEEGRQMIQAALHDTMLIIRAYALPAGTPKDRVTTVRRAFLETLKDPAFVEDARKAKMDIDPTPGEEMERIIHGFFKLDARLVARLNEALK